MTATNPTPHAQSRRTFLRDTAIAATGLSAAQLSQLAFERSAVADQPPPTQAPAASSALNSRYELSLHHYSVKSLFDSEQIDLESYAAFAKNTLGITNIEFAAEFCDELLVDPSKAKRIRENAEQIGVNIRTLLCRSGHQLDDSTAESRLQSLDIHMQWASVADSLGCEYIRVRAGGKGDKDRQLSFAAKGIGEFCDEVQSMPISVLIENVGGHSRDPDWLVTLAEKIGTERVGLVADFGNFKGDIYAGMQTLLPYTKVVCTKSWKFDAEGNETKIDFKRMMKIIADSEFSGDIAIEYLGDQPVDGIRKTASLVRKHS